MKKSGSTAVCMQCGSDEVECLDWVDANTNEVVGGGEVLSNDDTWCRVCEEHNGITTLEDWKDIYPDKKPLCEGGDHAEA